MTRGKALAVGSVAVVGLVAFWVVPVGRLGGANDTPVFRVKREPFVRRVLAEGYLKAVEATPVTAPVDVRGPLKIAWLAPDGSAVEAGEVVVRFDPTDMEKNLKDGRSDHTIAGHRIAKRESERTGQLANLDEDAKLADLELDHARRFKSEDPEIFSRSEIIESEIDETLAARRRSSAEGRRSVQSELAGADLGLLEIERRKADLKISEAEEGLQSLEVEAPHDGILVLKRNWRGEPKEIGATVWGGEAIAEIPKLADMEAEVFVLEADAGGLEEGQPATVTVESRPGDTIPAKIKKVDALAKRKDRWVPVQYFGVTLELEEVDPDTAKPGQRVAAMLLLDEVEDAFVVPRETIFEVEGERVVYRRNGRGFEPVPVTLGPTALGRVVVEEGLEEGDDIALWDPTESTDSGSGPENGLSASPGTLR